MEFEVSIRIKVDDRNEEVVELLRNAMYDLDEVTIKSLEVEHIK